MAEVFTPSWICNAQNNLIDNTWFGRDNVFNKEILLKMVLKFGKQTRKNHLPKVRLGKIMFLTHV
jgi:hypothetical protein